MEYFRRSFLGIVVAPLIAITLGLTGCGKKEEDSSGKSAVLAQKAETPQETKAISVPSSAPITEERVYYDFENDLSGWEVPLWARGKSDYVGQDVTISNEVASNGSSSMKIMTVFPGGIWAAVLVEIQQYLNMSPYRVVSADIYIPKDAPVGLKSKLILTVGENWKFVEMSRSVPLVPGEWVKINANIEPGSYDWKRVVPDEKFAEDVRKIAIRTESNRKPKYSGPMYIDNIRVGK